MELQLSLGAWKAVKGKKFPPSLCSGKWLSAKTTQPYVIGLDRARGDFPKYLGPGQTQTLPIPTDDQLTNLQKCPVT